MNFSVIFLKQERKKVNRELKEFQLLESFDKVIRHLNKCNIRRINRPLKETDEIDLLLSQEKVKEGIEGTELEFEITLIQEYLSSIY